MKLAVGAAVLVYLLFAGSAQAASSRTTRNPPQVLLPAHQHDSAFLANRVNKLDPVNDLLSSGAVKQIATFCLACLLALVMRNVEVRWTGVEQSSGGYTREME